MFSFAVRKRLASAKCLLTAIWLASPCAAIAAPVLWVSDSDAGIVRVIDTASGAFVGDPVAMPGQLPMAPVVSPDGSHVYVQSGYGPIAVIDVATQRIATTFDDPNPDAGGGLPSLSISPDGSALYAAAPDVGSIAFVDTRSGEVAARAEFSQSTHSAPTVHVSHDGATVFVLDRVDNTLVKVDVATRTAGARASVPLDGGGDGVAGFVVSSDDRSLYVATNLGQLVTMDTESMTIVSSMKAGSRLFDIDIAEDAGHVFLVNGDTCVVDVDLASNLPSATSLVDDNCVPSIAALRDGSRVFLKMHDTAAAADVLVAFVPASRGIAYDVPGFSYLNFDGQSIGKGPILPANGIWWNPAESGRSFEIDLQHGKLMLVASAYDASGSPTWLMASGAYDASLAKFTGEFDVYAGGQCLGCPYRAPSLAVDGGPVSIVFSSATTGSLTFAGQTIPIQKYVW